MKRCLVRRRADGLYLGPGARHTKWVADPNKARIFTQSGHARNALSPYIPASRYKVAIPGEGYEIWDLRYKAASAERKRQFDELYEIVTFTVTLT